MNIFELKKFMDEHILCAIIWKGNGYELIYENPNDGLAMSEVYSWDENTFDDKGRYETTINILWQIMDIIGVGHNKYNKYNIKIELDEKEVL